MQILTSWKDFKMTWGWFVFIPLTVIDESV